MLIKELMRVMLIPGGLLEPLQQCNTKSIPCLQWLQQWLSHLTSTSITFSKSLLQVSHIHTPLIHAAWLHHLWHHPHQDLVQYFLQCISYGFRVRFDGSGTRSAKNNLQSAVAHPTVVDDYYIHHVLSLGRISGPYSPSMCPDVHINKFGVIPKSYQQNK